MIWIGLAILAVTILILIAIEWQFSKVNDNLFSAGQVLISIDRRLANVENRLSAIAVHTAPPREGPGALEELIDKAKNRFGD